MNLPVPETSETERNRLGLLAEIAEAHGPEWREHFQPGSFGCHELLDRAAWLADAVEELVLTHPSCALNPKWYALADQAAAALRELYQCVGAEHLGKDDEPAPKK